MRDPYDILGVPRTATQDDIKKAYRKLARTLHPDLNPGDPKAEEKFKEATAAYDLLSDPDKRGRYDRGEIDATGAEKPRWQSYRTYAEGARGGKYRQAEGGFAFDMDDILSDLFGGARARAGAGAGQRMRGADQHYSLKIGFTDAVLGATKRVSLPTGKSLDVRVPPGTADGTTLRLKGQGAPGLDPGDAYVEIKVEPHPFFTRQGNDIVLELPVTLDEAVLGAKVTVPTVDGRVALTVPPGSNTGTVLRLRGKGVPHGKARGDQLVRLKVVLPDKPDPKLQDFLRDWAKANAYDVRAKVGMT